MTLSKAAGDCRQAGYKPAKNDRHVTDIVQGSVRLIFSGHRFSYGAMQLL